MANDNNISDGSPINVNAPTKEYYRLGVVGFVVQWYRNEQITSDVVRRMLEGRSPQARLTRVAKEVRELGIEQFLDELSFIEARLEAQNYAFTGKHDPAEYALTALERAMMIASTERHYDTLVRYNINAKKRGDALKRNRAAASTFPPGGTEERALVSKFRDLADVNKAPRNIPAIIHASYADDEDRPTLMSIRRTLQRLQLLPTPKPRTKK